MLIDAAADGQGVALARTILAASDLISGRLVIPIDVSLEITQHLLDRLPEGDRENSEDCYVPAMAAGGSGRGRAPVGNSHRLGKAC
jgi:hypothetical protein